MDALEAVQKKDLASLRRLLREDPRRAEARTPQGLSILQLACYHRFSQGVEALLAAGAQPDVWAAATLGDTARVREHVTADRALLEKPGPDGFTPLHLAAHFGHLDTMRALLNLGAAPGVVGGPALVNTPLHAALAGGQTAAARMLLDAGASVDARDHGGHTPLHVAAASGSEEGVALLLARGADPDATSHEGKRPVDFATERDFPAVAERLKR